MALPKTATEKDTWDIIITPKRDWWDLRLGELWRYRDLILLLVWRDFVSLYKQTILGPLWYIIQPLFTTVVFTIIFGNFAKIPTDGIPPFLFYLSGTTVWNYFSASLLGTSNTFTKNANLFGKVYFPRLSIPASVIISNLVAFTIGLIVFIGFLAYFILSGSEARPNPFVIYLPILLVLMAGLGLGFGVIVSALTTKYRDLQELVKFGVQLLMYATPVIYPLSAVEGNLRLLILANPMTPVVEIFRLAFLGTSAIGPASLTYSFGFMLILLGVGVIVFNRVEATFMDTV